ncbi:hypothetical protein [Streptomyces sp. IMTB 2501]|uniref:hypothetical protein n=1 Tax=Streptomyces sp. IMTB 2501 TaxID=1776340 RepID=UPI0035326C5E
MRRLTDQDWQKLKQIVRRGSTSPVRFRRAMMLLTSAGGNRAPVDAARGHLAGLPASPSTASSISVTTSTRHLPSGSTWTERP